MDTDADPHDYLRETDLEPLVSRYGPIELTVADDLFERMVRSIVSQQVSTAAATSIRERLYDAVEVEPEAILRADESVLRDAGLSRQKVDYVRNVAEAFEQHGYTREYFDDMTDEEVVSELTQIKGIGVWTAKMQLMFGLGRPDVFPVEDLGIRNGMQALYSEQTERSEMVESAETWRPYRSYASLYLWRSVD